MRYDRNRLIYILQNWFSILLQNQKTGWWLQPNWKILVKMEISPNRDENKQSLKPPESENASTRTALIKLKFSHSVGSIKSHVIPISHTIHVWYKYTYIWLISMVHVGKYTMRGCCGLIFVADVFPQKGICSKRHQSLLLPFSEKPPVSNQNRKDEHHFQSMCLIPFKNCF